MPVYGAPSTDGQAEIERLRERVRALEGAGRGR